MRDQGCPRWMKGKVLGFKKFYVQHMPPCVWDPETCSFDTPYMPTQFALHICQWSRLGDRPFQISRVQYKKLMWQNGSTLATRAKGPGFKPWPSVLMKNVLFLVVVD